MRHSGESVGNSFELACPGGSAGFRFFVASSGGEMGRRRENRFAQRLQPKSAPARAAFGQPQVGGYERKAGWKQVSSMAIIEDHAFGAAAPWRLFGPYPWSFVDC